MTQMPPIPPIQLICITTYYYKLLYISQTLSQVYLQELWITKCGSKLIYETLQASRKGGSVRFAHHLHPLEAASELGWR